MARTFGARVWIMTVISPMVAYQYYGEWGGPLPLPSQYYDSDRRWAAGILEKAANRFRRAGVRVETLAAEGSPASQIVKEARKVRAHLVVLGSHGWGRARSILLGSVADAVKNHVASSVLLARTAPRPSRILIATDGSVQSKRAAGIALRLARAWKAHARVVYVLENPRFAASKNRIWAQSDEFLKQERENAERGVTYQTVPGDPGDKIDEVATEKDCELIVMGHRGLGGVRSLVAGSVGNRVSHVAKCSVLLVKVVPTTK